MHTNTCREIKGVGEGNKWLRSGALCLEKVEITLEDVSARKRVCDSSEAGGKGGKGLIATRLRRRLLTRTRRNPSLALLVLFPVGRIHRQIKHVFQHMGELVPPLQSTQHRFLST
ncbi:hypothetical protein HID58_013781 [Brassica napus]|uniref:Uncharacterized protein n=1 Tax=Brassica napus TaxID=3708 RepID=A0ABQ7XJD4_BRANA|nr:hypothetical protein HID58_013781 [Brassica napus]